MCGWRDSPAGNVARRGCGGDWNDELLADSDHYPQDGPQQRVEQQLGIGERGCYPGKGLVGNREQERSVDHQGLGRICHQ
ncbi:hypothetical protein LAUMK41_00057 [Mycobacterium attenuatum]|nr:hypothetical protein LAUMK41_00057 [Mycobacterium attenuatum]